MIRLGSIITIAAAAVCSLLPAAAQDSPPRDAPWLNPDLPVAQRVDALVAQMSLEEKASQMVNQARAIPRLGVPAYDWWSEALHGVANNGYATVFPEPIGLAASFDAPTVHDMAVAIGTEARAKFNLLGGQNAPHRIFQGLDFWSPNINIFRDPRWGRGQETYGEDPFLTGKMGVAFVTGMQGDDPRYFRVIATAKHFAVHSGPESTRHQVDVPVSKHDQEDTYLPAFRALVTEGKVDSVMCAYNRINGQPGCASDFLLNDQLRGKWNFQGYVVSDCDAIADIQRGHRYTKTLAEAAAVSMQHGVDNDCADYTALKSDRSDYERYYDAAAQGLVSEAVLDASLKRLFTARVKLGLFDPPAMVAYAQTPESELNSPAHDALALVLARKSMVLLKNDGVLPLAGSVKRIAVVGPLADLSDVLKGNYNGEPLHPVTALAGIRRQFPAADITFEPGTNFLRVPEPVPASALATGDGQTGLKAELYNNADFSGSPALTRIDADGNFARAIAAVLPNAGPVSVCWTGFLAAPESGTYHIGQSGAHSRLWIDGNLAVDNSTAQEPELKTTDMVFEKGRKYAVRIEQNSSSDPAIKFVWRRLIDDPLGRAVAAANKADVVVAVVGITSALEGEEMKVDVPGFAGGDRTDLNLPADEEKLLETMKATGKKLIVVLMNGSALSVNWAAAHADAILDAWYSGQQGGTAIAETLAGVNNPAGRLPVTFYTGIDQLPPFSDYAMTGRTYRYFAGRPLYPFGYGLSYTKFAYGGLRLSSGAVKAGETLGVDTVVRNTGHREGDEVVQLYLSFPKVPGTPIRALRGFARVHLAPGARQSVHFDLSPRDLSSVTAAGDRVVASGAYKISVGGGQPGTGAAITAAAFTVSGITALPE